jgi:hypothetical protein
MSSLIDPIPPPEFLAEELSPEGSELLERGQMMELSPEEFVAEMFQLTPKDRAILLQINAYLLAAYNVEGEHLMEGYRQSRLAESVFLRASALEPGSVRKETMLEEAMQVLERHGEHPPEDLDLDRIEEVPVEDE